MCVVCVFFICSSVLAPGYLSALDQRKAIFRDFPGGPVVKTSPSNAGSVGSIPGLGAKIPHASWPKKPKHKTEAIL